MTFDEDRFEYIIIAVYQYNLVITWTTELDTTKYDCWEWESDQHSDM